MGDSTTKNAHPFLYEDWIFEHNGGIDSKELINYLSTDIKNQLTSETDSEVFFFLIMQYLKETGEISKAIKKTIEIVKKYPYRGLNFILSNGKELYVFRNVSPECKDKIEYYCLHYLIQENKIIISSDPLTKDNWIPIRLGELLEISTNLKIKKIKL